MLALRLSLLAALLTTVAAATACADEPNWPRWRGPLQNGHTHEMNIPVKWSADDVAWKTNLPGIGQSSPIIWEDKIFLTSALGQGKERLVLAVDRKSGSILWTKSAWKGEPEPIHNMNSWASATCVTDGKIVVAFFGRGGIHGYTVNGEHLWSEDLGKFESPWGTSACPVIVDDLVVQNCDADADAFIVALDKQTGKEAWRTKRPNNRGWSTPILVDSGKRRELVVNGHDGVRAYDPKTGRELWYCKSFNGRGEPTVTPAGDLLCVANGLAGDFYSIRPGGDGDVTDTHMAWHTPRSGGRDCPSPIVVGEFIIVCDLSGIATCYDATDGHVYWKERISTKTSGSPIAAGGLAYFVSEAGKTVVIKPGPKLEIVAQNELAADKDEIFRASPSPVQGQLFIRSTTDLYCIGKK